MKRAYSKSSYAKPCEQHCREQYPDEAERTFESAEEYYLGFMKGMPDLGENMMAKNMLDWSTIIAFYEASGHRMDGEVLGRELVRWRQEPGAERLRGAAGNLSAIRRNGRDRDHIP